MGKIECITDKQSGKKTVVTVNTKGEYIWDGSLNLYRVGICFGTTSKELARLNHIADENHPNLTKGTCPVSPRYSCLVS